MKKFSALIISLVMIAAMLVPCAVSAADTDVTVTNFKNEELGEYTGNLIYNPQGDTFADYSIMEDTDGTKYLHADFSKLTAPHTKQSRTGVRLLDGNQVKDFIRVEARVRFPYMQDWNGNTLALYTIHGYQIDDIGGKLGYISNKSFTIGDAPNGAIVNGEAAASSAVMYTDNTKIVGKWYTLTFVIDERQNSSTSGHVSYSIHSDDGQLLASATWTNTNSFSHWSLRAEDLIIVNEYLNNTDSGNIPKTANIDVSEVKVTTTNVWKVNVSAGEGGTASVDSSYVAPGGTANITATPNEGYEVDAVTVDGNTFVANDSGVYEITNITKDTDVAVTFKAAAPSVPTIDNVTVQPIAKYGDSPAAVVYAKVNGVAKGAGVVLKNAEGKEITLPAFDGDNPLTTGAFGIKVFGKAMEEGKAYSFIPYITYAGDDGDVTVPSAAQSFTFGAAE